MAGKKRLITGLTRAREQQYQQRVFVRLSASIEKAMRISIAAAMVDLANSYNDPGRQSSIMAAHRTSIARILGAGYSVAFQRFGPRILEANKKSRHPAERKNLFGGYDKAATDWIRAWTASKVTEIAGTTAAQAEAIISQAVGEAVLGGLGEVETGRLIRDAMSTRGPTITTARARVIARTETHAASQAAGQIAAQESGLRLKKEWISSGGPRTRDDHAEADGQTVGINEPFIVGGEELMHPGDPSGSPEQVINCRCVVAYVPVD